VETNRDDQELAMRQRLVQAAVALYNEDPAACTLSRAAAKAGVDTQAARRLYRTRGALLKGYYDLCLLRYRAMLEEIDGYADFDLAEKLSTFVYSLFDLFEEERDFIEATFEEWICRSPSKSRFQRGVEELMAEHLQDTELTGGIAAMLPPLMSRHYLRLVRHWLHDESPDAEETLALADKAIAFGAEALQSRLWTNGADLARYLLGRALPGGAWEAWADRFGGGRR